MTSAPIMIFVDCVALAKQWVNRFCSVCPSVCPVTLSCTLKDTCRKSYVMRPLSDRKSCEQLLMAHFQLVITFGPDWIFTCQVRLHQMATLSWSNDCNRGCSLGRPMAKAWRLVSFWSKEWLPSVREICVYVCNRGAYQGSKKQIIRLSGISKNCWA